MKKQLTNAIGKKVFTFLAASVIFLAGASTSFALPDRAVKVNAPAEISYKGVKDKFLVFKMDYQNELVQPFELVIKNEQNDVLYSKKFEAKSLNTDFYFTELPDNCKLTFTIITGKKEASQTFEINNNVKTVQEVVVKGV